MFIRSCGDVILQNLDETPAKAITITVDEIEQFRMGKPAPDEKGELTLRLREILEGIVIPQMTLADASWAIPDIRLGITYRESGNHAVDGQLVEGDFDQTYEYKLPAIKGGYDPDYDILEGIKAGNWLTWRDERVKTCRHGKEYLYLYIPKNEAREIVYVITFHDGTQVSFVDGSPASPGAERILRVDASVSAIKKLPTVIDCGKQEQIRSYAIYARKGMQPGRAVTFDVAEEKSSAFIFRGSLGFFETVWSHGAASDKMTYESQVFTRQHQEVELGIKAIRQTETFSGWLRTERERNLWMEFIESDERYVLTPDGIIKPIIMDAVSCDMRHAELAGLSFTWHMAKVRQGSGMPGQKSNNGFDYRFDINF